MTAKSHTTTRRAVLSAGAAAAAVAAVPAVAAATGTNRRQVPIAELYRRYFALWASYEQPAKPEPECLKDWAALEKEWGQTLNEVIDDLMSSRPATAGEVIALIRVARKDLLNVNSDNEGNVDPDVALVVHALNRAERFLELLNN